MATFEPNPKLCTVGASRQALHQFTRTGAWMAEIRPPAKHRARTRPEKRRRRAHQAQLRRVTLRSLTCHLLGRSSSTRWA